MPRTETTIINDLMSRLGEPDRISATWEIPVKREGWECKISVSLSKWRGSFRAGLHIDIHAYAYPVYRDYHGIASYCTLSGHATPARLTRKWMDQVFSHEIETARLALLAFTEDDLHEVSLFSGMGEDVEERMEEYRAMSEYFESTLK